MPEIITRSAKGSELSFAEGDANLKRTVVSKTANYTLTSAENRQIIECNTNAFTVEFPDCATLVAALDTGDYFVDIKNNNSATNNITIARTGTDTFDGETSLTLKPYQAIRIAANSGGNGWEIVERYFPNISDIAALSKTDGNFIVGDGTNWVAESGATARKSLGIVIVEKYKTADTVVTTSTSLADDDHLKDFVLDANTYYLFDGYLDYSADDTTADLKIRINFDNAPQRSHYLWSSAAEAGSAPMYDPPSWGFVIQLGSSTDRNGITMRGLVLTHATLSTNIDFQWGQNVASNTTTLHKGSWMRFKKVLP